ncbi:ribosomal-protein-alanine N-acetyltransferase [Geosporobacter subterraneus DSM 17957]|uniref:Ribosomal-protein-alanine N-acetyltransferase n=1 Tax=Geosporobacter subterraneus DSM 17957 TaxID=1121919 RepID=A0A1M6IXK5_9FIRM|nr:GNAT family protein [Geosporobacter subterraneus]SHJ39195.1 ribosomal-protein-alanine N-acetyltransferase [Geosporobacter subterraneus DSM 17957]
MEVIKISLLQETDTEELYQFELENRTFFERMVLTRRNEYYDPTVFKSIMKELVEDQEEGCHYMYLNKDSMENIIGRVNLVSIARGCFNKAELGYRIGEVYNGKGYATRAVGMVLEEAQYIHKLLRIEAGISPENIGSQILLIKNGFQFFGRNHQYIYQNRRWHDSINFEKILV